MQSLTTFLRHQCLLFIAMMIIITVSAHGDWKTYRGDNQRSGVSSEALSLPLSEVWTYQSQDVPNPAWPEMPAKTDYWNFGHALSPTNTYDRVFHVAIADGHIYFGSTVDDTVYCLDAETAKTRWTFVTEGPIRLSPSVVNGKVYVGSDDGCIYCLNASDGNLVWKYRPTEDKRIFGNGRMISRWPIRSGIVVEDGKVYFTCGVFPTCDTFLCAVDVSTGREILKEKIEISPQGYMLASSSRLYVPTGRTAPALFDKISGKHLGSMGGGGCFAIVQDDMFIAGPNERGQLSLSGPESRERIATAPGYQMIAKGPATYLLSEGHLSALNRKAYVELNSRIRTLEKIKKRTREQNRQLKEANEKLSKCLKWDVPCEGKYAMIIAGDMLFVGGENAVYAYNARTGELLWQDKIQGKGYGLAAAGGQLLVSTDEGIIHCFGKGASTEPQRITATATPYPETENSAMYAAAAEAMKAAAEAMKKAIDFDKGYCLILGAEKGQLAYELASHTNLHIIGIEPDKEKVDEARKRLASAGLYGKRVAIHHGPLDKLPYPSCFANLITSDQSLLTGKTTTDAAETWRVLRPCGGVVAIGTGGNPDGLLDWGRKSIAGWKEWQSGALKGAIATREALPGQGEWTHTYADAGNSACSRDDLVSSDIELQWFGRPGPREMIDRHHRNVPPLYKDGRLFVPGDDIVYCVDAYNGAMLWELRIPDSRRLGVFLDSGSMAVDENYLYVAKADQCLGFDVKTGELKKTLTMPQPVSSAAREWGYLAYQDDLLFGSGRRKGASYTETSRAADAALWYHNMKVVTSDFLFAKNRKTGSDLWTYKQGLILNPTLTVGDGCVFFIETTSSKAMRDKLGRLPIKTLFDGGKQHLVALDIRTGQVRYKEAIDTSPYKEPVSLNFSKGVLILNGSKLIGKNVTYHVDAYESKTGRRIWEATHNSELARDGGHGEYNRHPTIVKDTVYVWPYAYDLKTGRKQPDWKFKRRGHGCGGISASNYGLFWRGQNPYMYDLNPGKGPVQLTKVTRPGCWINIIPAGGMIMIPEASSGCTCGHSIQASMAYLTKLKE